MKSGWDSLSDEERLRRTAVMHRPQLAPKEAPPGDVDEEIKRAELHVARLKAGGMTPQLADISQALDLQHRAADEDEVVLCEALGGGVARRKGENGHALVSYNPRAAMTIAEWPNCVALEPAAIHARRAYEKQLDQISIMIGRVREIDATDVRFVCPFFFVVRSQGGFDYLCHEHVRYPLDSLAEDAIDQGVSIKRAEVSYKDQLVVFPEGSTIKTADIANFDFYLKSFYRCRYWLTV
jgi:hypothetical protein